MRIGITAVNFSGNKGATAMLQSIVNNMREENVTSFSLFSVYPEEDTKLNPYPNLDIIPAKPQTMIFIAFPLAILHRIFSCIKPVQKLFAKQKTIKGFLAIDLVIDAAGISFVDSRGFVMNTYNFICAAIPLLLKKSVIKFPQAMGPMKKGYNKFWAKMVLPKLDMICARGEKTFKYLKDIGLENIEICADSAFLMPDDDMSKKAVQDKIGADKFYSQRFITLSISSVVYKACQKKTIDYLKILKRFIEHANEVGYGVLIIANAARKNNLKLKNNDLPIGDELFAMLDDKKAVRWYHEEQTPELIREVIAKSDILVGSRFHAMIGALEKEVPVLLVGWSHKYQEVLDMFSLKDNALDYGDLNLDIIVEKFDNIVRNREKIKKQIASHLLEVKKSSQKSFDFAHKMIRSIKTEQQKFMGHVEKSYAGYANNEDIRGGAASGGVVTALLVDMLEKKDIDGALVSKQLVRNGKIVVESFIATSKDALLDCRTSIYINFNLSKSYNLISQFEGDVAVVCLPCNLPGLEALERKEDYKRNIKYKLCLFCGGVAEPRLLERVLEKEKIELAKVERIYARMGHWRGKTVVKMISGERKFISYKYNWATYKNAFYYSSKKCYACTDLFGVSADISFGDIWLSEMKKKAIKHTAIVTRNKKGKKLIENALKAHVITGEIIEPEKIQSGNKRALIYKFFTAEARQKNGPKYGFSGPKNKMCKSKWNHRLAARIAARNMVRSSDEQKMERTFRKNKRLMFIYMGLIRLLLSF